jgi:putative ABC transport system permease protein
MMTPLEAARRLLYLLRRDHYTAELEEEMRLHRQLRAERLQGGGMSPDGARYAAKRRFGNGTHIQERSRDMWGFDWVEQAAADLRFAVRRLRNRPAFSLSTIAVTALGIGATTAVFSAVDAAILRPLPFLRPGELVTLTRVQVPFEPEVTGGARASNEVNLLDVLALPDLFANAAAYASGGLNIEDQSHPRRVRAGVVTASLFPTLGVAARTGRTFSVEEGKPRGPKVVLISDALWRTHFGGADILGRTIRLSGHGYTIIGIMPPNFGFPSESELWIPMTNPTTSETFAPFRGWLPQNSIARLAPGVTRDLASKQLLARWELGVKPREPGRRYRSENQLEHVRATGAALPLQREIVGGDRRKALYVLMGATALLLLIACANVANLLLSDGATRHREVALREVLGASRGRVIRLLLSESVLLAVTGAAIGVALAPLTLGIMRALMPEELAGTTAVRVDLRVLGFAALLALVTGVVFGLWPALGTSRSDPAETMKAGGGHGATSGRMGHTRRLLITAELALTVMLLVGAGLMLKSFHRIMTQDFGMDPNQVGTLEVSFARNVATADRARVIRAMLDHLAGDPAITASGVVNDIPLRGDGGIGISVEADGMPRPRGVHFPRYLIASGGYFNALGIPLLRGRTFQAGDDTVGERAAIINRAMARTFWGETDALNRTFHIGGDSVPYTVVGIVADVRETGPAEAPTAQMYFAATERVPVNVGLVARSALPPEALLSRLTAAVRHASPSQATYNVRMMEAVIGKSVAPRRTNTLLIAIFGALALVLSAFGVYAVVSYGVTRRAREFGIRAALGANRTDIVALVGREMLLVIALGLAAGLAGAWALSRVMASMLYEVPARDVATFLTVPAVLLIPAAVATLVPALRAMRVSPTEVMRAE